MRLEKLPLKLAIVALLLFTPSSFAQQIVKQSCDLPLLVTHFDSSSRTDKVVRDLDRKDLALQLGSVPASVESASIDDGPKRVAIVLDTRGKIPSEEWKLATEMASSFTENARPQDSFALFLTGSDSATGPFLPPSELQEQLQALSSSRPPATDSSERIYDTLIAAANNLNPPNFGDAIYVFGHFDDSGSKAGLDQLRELILRNRIRLYGLSFADPLSGQLPPAFNPNKPLPASVAFPKLDDLAHDTGYPLSYTSVKSLSFPGQTQLRKSFLALQYAGIAGPYRVVIPASSIEGPIDISVTVINRSERKINAQDVHYPHVIYPCVSSPQTTP